MAEPLRILYVGEMGLSSKSRMMARAFQDLGHQLDVVDLNGERKFEENQPLPIWFRIQSKLLRSLDHWPDFGAVNFRSIEAIGQREYDIFWVTKVPCLRPRVLSLLKKNQPNCKSVYFSTDDLLNRKNSSRSIRRAWPLFDFVISTNPLNHEPSDQRKLGLSNLMWENFFFDEHLHARQVLSSEEKKIYEVDVVFVGSFEEERANSLLALAQGGVSVIVWGNMWPSHWEGKHPNLKIHFQDLETSEYVKAISGAKICLGFLRKANRDLVTGRSVEIPGVGGFLLTERTRVHVSMFVEDEEAAFFSSNEELVEKVKYYLGQDELRSRIAQKGHQKIHDQNYSFQKRLPKIISKIVS